MKSLTIGLASCLWSGLNGVRRFLHQKRILSQTELGCRVISVGNIQAGGAGKTPLVAQIAREAAERGLKCCILSRGYRGLWEASGGVLVPGGSALANQCGDEAALLHDLCPNSWIGVGRDRVAQYTAVVEKAGVKMDLVVLDDGFQNHKIQKDLEIVALTSVRPWQQLHREFSSALGAADLVIWTKGEKEPDSPYQIKVRYSIVPPVDLQQAFHLVTGLADGDSAYRLALNTGYRVVEHLAFSDHYRYSFTQIQEWLKKAAQKQAKILLTGKDWVKWRDLGVTRDQVIVLEPKLEFVTGEALWRQSLWGG